MKSMDPGPLSSRSARLLGIILFFGSAFFYQDPEWNGNSRLILTRAIVEQGSLQVDDYHAAASWETGDKAFYNGHFYSDKAIGASLLAVPFYFLIYHAGQLAGISLASSFVKHVLTTAVMGSSFTLCGLCMYDTALRITGDQVRAGATTLFLSFGSMLWPYSAVFYGHLPAAAFLMLAFSLMFRESTAVTSNPRASWFWIGLAAGLAFLSDHTTSVVLIGLAVYALYALRDLAWRDKGRRVWPAVAGAMLPLLLFFAYNLAVYGRAVAFGYAYEVEERFQGIMGLGVMGIRLPTPGAAYHISFDPKFGLFWLSPLLLLAPVGYVAAFKDRRNRAEALLSIYVAAVIFYVNAASFLWYGGSTFGPRLLIPALPFIIVPLALLPAAWMVALEVLGVVSIANMMIPLFGQIQFTKLEFKPTKGGFFVADKQFDGFSLLYKYGIQQVVDLAKQGRSPWSLGTGLGLPFGVSAAGLVAIETTLIVVWRRLARSGSNPSAQAPEKRP